MMPRASIARMQGWLAFAAGCEAEAVLRECASRPAREAWIAGYAAASAAAFVAAAISAERRNPALFPLFHMERIPAPGATKPLAPAWRWWEAAFLAAALPAGLPLPRAAAVLRRPLRGVHVKASRLGLLAADRKAAA